MSLCIRPRGVPTASALLIALSLRFAGRSCSRNSRSFSSTNAHNQSSKRELQTATAYRPHTLPESYSPLQRNAAGSSIVGGIPAVNEFYPVETVPQTRHLQSDGLQNPPFSFPESGVLKPTQDDPASPSASPSTLTQTATKPRRSKLRPRKAAMSFTPAALSHLKALLSQPDPKLIRVGVKNRGCSGLSYHLEFVDKAAPFDEVVEQDGVKVLVDSKALFSIIGSEMDWQENQLSSRFVFHNPNIKDECGCGESFMV